MWGVVLKYWLNNKIYSTPMFGWNARVHFFFCWESVCEKERKVNPDIFPYDLLDDNSFHRSHVSNCQKFYCKCIKSLTGCWFLNKNVAWKTKYCIFQGWVLQKIWVCLEPISLKLVTMIAYFWKWILCKLGFIWIGFNISTLDFIL